MVFEINLLPEKYRKKKIRIQLDARALGVFSGVILVASIAFFTYNQGRKITGLEGEIEVLTAQKIPLETQAQRVRRFQDEVQTLTNNITTLEGLGQRNGVQLRVLDIVHRQLPDNVWYRDINQEPPQQRGRQTGPAIPADRVLNLLGVAMRKEGVAELITRLKSEDLFQEVITNYIRPYPVSGTNDDVFEFSLTATLAPITLNQAIQDLMNQLQSEAEAMLQQLPPPR
jgi:Tfp pilus assembly protein PilN